MKRLLLSTALGLLALTAQAADIGVTAHEVHARVQQDDAKLLFVDVRDPIEIMFVGFTDAVHVNVPYLLVDRSAWDEQRGTYRIAQNPNRSEERRVGKECRARGWPDDLKKEEWS